jgi:hypothetical protein
MGGRLLLLFLCQIAEQAVENRQDETEGQGPPETVNLEILNKVVDTQDNEGIDDQQEETQRDDGWRTKLAPLQAGLPNNRSRAHQAKGRR